MIRNRMSLGTSFALLWHCRNDPEDTGNRARYRSFVLQLYGTNQPPLPMAQCECKAGPQEEGRREAGCTLYSSIQVGNCFFSWYQVSIFKFGHDFHNKKNYYNMVARPDILFGPPPVYSWPWLLTNAVMSYLHPQESHSLPPGRAGVRQKEGEKLMFLIIQSYI